MTTAEPGPTMRWRNFDAIRLAAAVAVVVSHSFLLSSDGYQAEPLVRLLGDGHDLGRFAVGVFFIISGFLITHSYVRRVSVQTYVFNRVMRIFPGLIACTLVTALVIGPLFASDLGRYLGSSETWQYVWRTALLQPGGGSEFPAAMYEGPQGTMMLGTTWSLAPEFACYIGVLIVGAAGLLRLPIALAITVAGVWAHSHWELPLMNATAWALMFFAAGAALFLIHERRRPGTPIVLAASGAFVIAAGLGYLLEGLALFGSVALIQLATSERILLPNAARFGDLSYGVYLYGWPAQQVVRALWGPSITWWQMFLSTMPLALAAAWFSWHLIESRALASARRYQRGQRSAAGAARSIASGAAA